MTARTHHHKRPTTPPKTPLWDAPPLKPYGAYGLCVRCHLGFHKAGTHADVCWQCLTDTERAMRKEAA